MSSPPDRRPQPARIALTAQGVAAPDFGECYHSAAGALGETRAVFIDGQDLPARFARGSAFTVGEIGFGTGLNTLAVWQAFRAHAPAGAQLTYIAVEQYPLTPEDLRAALAPWADAIDGDGRLVEALSASYPPPTAGLTALPLRAAGGADLDLRLAVGEAETALSWLAADVHAWLLDGFAPAKNPAPWRGEVMAQVARLSRPGTTAASFTVARNVRTALGQAGFTVARRPGYGAKRHRLYAELPGTPQQPEPIAPTPDRDVAVIGAGLAGAWTAWHLARDGWRVHLVADGDDAGASANPAATLNLPPAGEAHARGRFLAAAFRHARAGLQTLKASGHTTGFRATGLLHLGLSAKESRRLAATAPALGLSAGEWHELDPTAAEALAGTALIAGGALVPRGGWLDVPRLVAALLADRPPTSHTSARVAKITSDGASWLLVGQDGCVLGTSGHVVLATGADGPQLPAGLAGLPLTAVRGQADRLQPPAGQRSPPVALSGGGYAVPPGDGTLWVGASFDRQRDDSARLPDDTAGNIARAQRLLPGWANGAPESLQCWAGRRATTPDRLPLAGQLAPGLAVNLGHGARGATTAPLAAALVAADLAGLAPPLETDLAAILAPTRFRPGG